VPELSARRKADRAAMASQVAILAGGYGLLTRPVSGPRMRGTEVSAPHGLKVTVKFDANNASGPDTYVLSWHGVEEGTRLDPCWFARVNPYHGHKATDVVQGFGPLVRLLRVRFAAIADGYAFTLAGDEVPV
jgi:hypothetical protein